MIDASDGPGDIWFRTQLSLHEVGEVLAAKLTSHDSEDTWQWVIADLHGQAIDITRNHTIGAAETDTRIFMADGASSIPPELCQTITSALVQAEIRPVYLGRWVHQSGNDFSRVVQQKVD